MCIGQFLPLQAIFNKHNNCYFKNLEKKIPIIIVHGVTDKSFFGYLKTYFHIAE